MLYFIYSKKELIHDNRKILLQLYSESKDERYLDDDNSFCCQKILEHENSYIEIKVGITTRTLGKRLNDYKNGCHNYLPDILQTVEAKNVDKKMMEKWENKFRKAATKTISKVCPNTNEKYKLLCSNIKAFLDLGDTTASKIFEIKVPKKTIEDYGPVNMGNDKQIYYKPNLEFRRSFIGKSMPRKGFADKGLIPPQGGIKGNWGSGAISINMRVGGKYENVDNFDTISYCSRKNNKKGEVFKSADNAGMLRSYKEGRSITVVVGSPGKLFECRGEYLIEDIEVTEGYRSAIFKMRMTEKTLEYWKHKNDPRL